MRNTRNAAIQGAQHQIYRWQAELGGRAVDGAAYVSTRCHSTKPLEAEVHPRHVAAVGVPLPVIRDRDLLQTMQSLCAAGGAPANKAQVM